uniref:Methylamine utilization protein MauG n=1 Tax=uncultured bacterium BAC10-4 TaxID=333425 RepID=Q4JIU4_9BACT|nr:MauG [uncultured bacterium BAC10-4]
MLQRARGIRALLIGTFLVCLLSPRAGRPQDQPKLLNPFAGDPDGVKEGRRLFMSNGCSGCHGLGGGGGMGKPILDDEWIFGSDDQTLYKLVKGQIPQQTMPKTFAVLPDEQVWKLLAYVRSLYKGDPSLITWGLTPPPDAAVRIAALARPVSAFTPPKGLQDMEITTPSDNPMTLGKIKLGEQLFFDKRLSKAKSMSCESCHVPEKAWTDGLAFSKKFDGTLNKRHTPTLCGVAFYPELYWDGRAAGLEALVLDVMKTQMGADPDAVAKELETIPAYKSAFEAELGGPPTSDRIAKAVATFVRTIHAGDTLFDNLPAGESDNEVAKGFKVFSEVTHCTLCHLPPLFSDTLFHNMGVGSDKKPPDPGRGKVLADNAIAAGTPVPAEAKTLMGAFKTASLRGVPLRAPYFHDGRAKTIEEAADIMMKGGIPNPHLDEKLKAWPMTPEQRTQLLAFLRSLTPDDKPYARPEVPQAAQ